MTAVASLGGLCTGCMLSSVMMITCTGVYTELREVHKPILLSNCH